VKNLLLPTSHRKEEEGRTNGLDVANGARGVVVGIVLDKDEDSERLWSSTGVVELKKMPAYVLVRLRRTKAKQLDGGRRASTGCDGANAWRKP